MILDTIVETKKEEVKRLRSHGVRVPADFEDLPVAACRGFANALKAYEGVSIIAEVKKASPSKGVIAKSFDPVEIASNYNRHGAQAISVLTDATYFQGSLGDLMKVRQVVDLPILRKDFIIDSLQIEEARIHGADAILLIAAILDEYQIRDFQQQAEAHSIDSLVEVHNEAETDKALLAGAKLIGINNRNLKDFTVDINTTFRLLKRIPSHIPVVSESGLKTREDILALQASGVAAALIGETLMRAGATSDLLKSLKLQ